MQALQLHLPEQAVSELQKLYEEFKECNSDRTMVQLRHFVLNRHDTPGRQYLQIITELRVAWNELRRLNLDRKEILEKQTLDERDQLRLEQIELELDAKVKECGKLLQIRQELLDKRNGKPYTAEEIEEEEKEYYAKRLRHQAVLDVASRVTGVSIGNLQAMEQLGVLKLDMQDGKLLIEDSGVNIFPKQLSHDRQPKINS